ncbi:MAG: hypothetical protein F6K16_23020 [Symploca sp. SIO2B6]|nr:hypothetical protein [Symploca sp. SIO2B6]
MYSDTRWYQLLQSENPNYLEVVKAYEEYFKTHELVKSPEIREYKNWLKTVGTNFDAQGNLLTSQSYKDDLAILEREQ